MGTLNVTLVVKNFPKDPILENIGLMSTQESGFLAISAVTWLKEEII